MVRDPTSGVERLTVQIPWPPFSEDEIFRVHRLLMDEDQARELAAEWVAIPEKDPTQTAPFDVVDQHDGEPQDRLLWCGVGAGVTNTSPSMTS